MGTKFAKDRLYFAQIIWLSNNLVKASTIGIGVRFYGINILYVHMGTVFLTDFTQGERKNIFVIELNDVF